MKVEHVGRNGQSHSPTGASGGQIQSLKGRVSDEEWRTRVDLAALYRLTALEGWDFLVFNHISARLPGPEHHFLVNPYGLRYEEITASSLVSVDMNGEILSDTPYPVNGAGFVIHSAVHMARPDARFVMHLHSSAGVAVSAQKHGLLPISQDALVLQNRLSYHDFEGLAFDLDERSGIAKDLGDNQLMLLRNHGTLALGLTAADCWVAMYTLEKACVAQIMALSAGIENVQLVSEKVQAEVSKFRPNSVDLGALNWSACLRLLERKSPGYDA